MAKNTYKQLQDAAGYFKINGISAEDIHNQVEKMKVDAFWNGFDACYHMVINLLNNHDEKALFTVHNFISKFKAQLGENTESYKKDNKEGA